MCSVEIKFMGYRKFKEKDWLQSLGIIQRDDSGLGVVILVEIGEN